MEDIICKYNLAVKKLRGKDEFEMYKNYINDIPYDKIAICLHMFFKLDNLQEKSNSEAARFRVQGNISYSSKNYYESLRLYTKSLRYANYNSEDYACALANRSAVYFALEDYQSSVDNISLCLEANYPCHLKPKVYMRKAMCYQKLGKVHNMRGILMDLLNYLDNCTNLLLKQSREKYIKMIKELITTPAEMEPDPEDHSDVLPTMEANPTFLSASSSIMLIFNKGTGSRVVAKKNIVPGEVLFMEKAYIFAPVHDVRRHKEYCPIYCQYCLQITNSSIPCKKCVKHLYCNELCRDNAWKEFHQWECVAVQAGLFKISHEGHLSLRIILKAVLTGISTNTINIEDIDTYGKKDNNYPFVYNLPTALHKMERSELLEFVVAAALIINYLKTETKFFEMMKQLPAYANKSYKDLMNRLGGLIIRHCTQMRRNAFPVRIFNSERIPKLTAIASAVCPSVTMMNHSCKANTVVYSVGDVLVVKAAKNIKIDEDVCFIVSGVPMTGLDKVFRQNLLQKFFYLNCTCPICSDPGLDTGDSYLCIKCQGPAQILDNNALKQCTCLHCNFKFILPSEVVVKEKLVKAFFTRFQECGKIDDANRCLQLCKTIFRPHHSLFEDLYRKLLEYYKEKREVECFIKIGKMLIEYVELKYGCALQIGLCIYTLCVMVMEVLEKTAVNINIKNFREILEDITNFVEKAKIAFSLEYPSFFTRLRIMEKSIFEFRILHTLQIAKEKRHNSVKLAAICL